MRYFKFIVQYSISLEKIIYEQKEVLIVSNNDTYPSKKYIINKANLPPIFHKESIVILSEFEFKNISDFKNYINDI